MGSGATKAADEQKLAEAIVQIVDQKDKKKQGKSNQKNTKKQVQYNSASTAKIGHTAVEIMNKQSPAKPERSKSTIKIKEERKKLHNSLVNPQNKKKSPEKVADVSQVIDIEQIVTERQGRKPQVFKTSRPGGQSTRKFEPKLNELIKLYGFT